MLLGLTESASAAFNPAAQYPHCGNSSLRESEASEFSAYEIADLTKENGEGIYDGALGVPVYVRQNPWTFFDSLGLKEKMPTEDKYKERISDAQNKLDQFYEETRQEAKKKYCT
jgi:hypothetical protein